MSYDVELREKVVDFVKQGGRKTDAARIFKVSRITVYNWLKLSDLTPKERGSHNKKMDRDELASHVKSFPNATLKERAEYFDVHVSTIWSALRKT